MGYGIVHEYIIRFGHSRHGTQSTHFSYVQFEGSRELVLCNTIDTTRYRDTKVVVLTSKFGIVGIDYAI